MNKSIVEIYSKKLAHDFAEAIYRPIPERVTIDFEPNLKPCPFCGNKDVCHNTENHCFGHGDYRELHYATCKSCGVSAGGFMTGEKLEAAWNRRD